MDACVRICCKMADSEGIRGVLEPKLFHFHGEFQEKIGQTAQNEPPPPTPSAHPDPLS